MASLDLKYAYSVLERLTEKDSFMKQELFDIVSSNQTLDKLLDALEKDGYIVKKLNVYGRRTYTISLTDKGKAVAEQLKIAEEAGKGELVAEISEDKAKKRDDNFNRETATLNLRYINAYKDYVTVEETRKGSTQIIKIYAREDDHGVLRLWCEADNSFNCIHARYAWTLPEVQELYWKIVKEGK